MLPQKSFKIEDPRKAKNAFPEISAWKNQIKISQHVALLLNLGVLEKLSAGCGGNCPPCPPPSSYGPGYSSSIAFCVASY